MKRWKNIPALLALIALLLPCADLTGHQHAECAPETACVAAHPACHACSKTVCSEKAEILPANSIPPVEPPVRLLSVIWILPPVRPLLASVGLPAGNLVPLLTVQLLI